MTTTIPTADIPARFAAALVELSACQPAREWATGLDYITAWNSCTKPSWLFWLLDAKQAITPQTNDLLVRAFAREVEHLNADPLALSYIEVWAAAQSNAEAVAKDAAGYAATYAARSATRSAVRSTAWSAAASSARSDAWSDAWSAARVRQCEIIRQICPMPILL